MKNKTVRIATSNNFNFSQKEIDDFYLVKKEYPNTFVNSHIKTNIKDKDIPVIITLNPNITDMQEIRGHKENIKALRVKFVLSKIGIKSFINCLEYAKQENLKVLVTFYRSKRNTTLKLFGMNRKHYERRGNFHRLTKQAKLQSIKIVEKLAKNMNISNSIYYCDKIDQGCNSCLNCSKLTYNNSNEIYEINLQSSGNCKFNCIGCFAQYINIKNKKDGLKCNVIKQNSKQGNKSNYIKIDGLNETSLHMTEQEINNFKDAQERI